jgi:hypothetical protein
MTKIAGSGSISQRHGSADPDPSQNVMDPQHCLKIKERRELKNPYPVAGYVLCTNKTTCEMVILSGLSNLAGRSLYFYKVTLLC